ncbi:MAG: hypothetical protein R8K50_03150 [Mariprofundus sp.]
MKTNSLQCKLLVFLFSDGLLCGFVCTQKINAFLIAYKTHPSDRLSYDFLVMLCLTRHPAVLDSESNPE